MICSIMLVLDVIGGEQCFPVDIGLIRVVGVDVFMCVVRLILEVQSQSVGKVMYLLNP